MKKTTFILFTLVLFLFSGCGKGPLQPTTGTSPQSTQQGEETVIGEERAKEIALERAGLSEDGVTFGHIELDRDDGILRYEFDFYKDQYEYEIEIKADDGTILSFEKDYQD